MTYNPQIHHRRSIRLKDYDYTQAGSYFVTVCVQNRAGLFGEIGADGEMRLNANGDCVAECWNDIPRHFPRAELDMFTVMPNHIHGIIVLHDPDENAVVVGAKYPRTAADTSPLSQPIGTQSGSLGAILQNFKSVSTRKINAARRTPGGRVWQRNYYEHVVRNEPDLERIRVYIANNPRQWAFDAENPARTKI